MFTVKAATMWSAIFSIYNTYNFKMKDLPVREGFYVCYSSLTRAWIWDVRRKSCSEVVKVLRNETHLPVVSNYLGKTFTWNELCNIYKPNHKHKEIYMFALCAGLSLPQLFDGHVLLAVFLHHLAKTTGYSFSAQLELMMKIEFISTLYV